MPFRYFLVLLPLTILTGCGGLIPPSTPTPSPLEIKGRRVFDSYCARCHGTTGDTVVVGPSLAGVATRGNIRIAGMDAEAYIRSSILDPGAYTVEGFPEGIMPINLKEEIPPEDVEAIIAFLLTLK